MPTARDEILEKAQDVVASYAASRGRSNPWSSLSTLLRQMQREYEDRFLYELIQNAYDAHPADANGEIAILLAEDEGDHGVLYVANRGNPFARENFDAICELAQSNKTPDESIGNKGVGFKSVLQVCEWPEIYSRAHADSPGFDGYCFTFARLNAYDELAGGDKELADALRSDVAPYFLPVPLVDPPSSVLEFGERGFASVLRLPLKSAAAAEVSRDRVAKLESESVPLHLFLPRLERLDISRRGVDGGSSALALTRDAIPIDDPAGDPEQRYELVDLGPQGEWFVASRRVPGEAMAEAIHRSVVDNDLDASWESWTRDTWVSVAARTDGHDIEPRMYTYLPMEGEARAPLHGHLHAPFSTKLARTSVSEGVHLNALLLDYAARAATSAVLTFASREEILPPTALVDLVAWQSNHHDRVTASFAATGVEMRTAQLFPIQPLPDSRKRGGFDATYSWPFRVSLLNANRLARDAHAELIADSITGTRLGRLESYCQAFFGGGFRPPPETRAKWVEAAARGLHERRAKPPTWDRFYGDLAEIFDDDPDSLRGRRILLGDDGELHKSPSDADDVDQPYVFFPPARERTDEDDEVEGDFDLKPPASLRKSLILMSEELSWNRQDGRVRRATPARRFLVDSKLVKRFKTVDLLEHVARALARSRSKTLARDALRFAFNLHSSTRNIQTQDLRGLHLRVPCGDTWRRAADALFCREWGTPNADALAELLDRGSTASADLSDLRAHLVLAPDKWPFPIPDTTRWRTFLEEIGVRDGLWPSALPHGSDPFDGHELEPAALARRFRLAAADQSRWTAAVRATPGHRPGYPRTAYRGRPVAAVLPGQADYEQFDDATRSVYASLVLAGLGRWPEHLGLKWARFQARHRSAPDELVWPSPIAAFLRDAAWLPTTQPAARSEDTFVRPDQAWYFSDAGGEGLPHFSPLVSPSIRRALGSSPTVLDAAKQLGLGSWRDPDHAPRLLRHLASLVEGGHLTETGYLAFRNAHEDAWERATQWDPGDFAEAMSDTSLVLARSGRFVVQTPTQLVESGIYIVNERRSLAARILEASGVPILFVGDADPDSVRDLLAPIVNGSITTLNAVTVEVATESGTFVPSQDSPRLVDGALSWTTDLVQLVLEARRTRLDTSSARRRAEIVDKLRRVRVCHLPAASVIVGGVSVTMHGASRRAVPVDDSRYPTLVSLETDPPDLDAVDGVLAIIPALCELLGISDYQSTVELALERWRPISPDPPSVADFARMLDLDPDAVAEVFSHVGAPLASLARLIAPVAAYYGGSQAGHALLHEIKDLDEDSALVAAVARLAPDLPDPELALTLARQSASIGDLRERLGLDYARFNIVLKDLGAPYAPVHNETGHAQTLEHYVQTHREQITTELRARYLHTFREHGPLDDYIAARDLRSIQPDLAWLDGFDIPPDDLIASHVAGWIEQHGQEPVAVVTLEPVARLRRQNHAVLSQVFSDAKPMVAAWAHKRGQTVPASWNKESAVPDLIEAASAAAFLDFDLLTEIDAINWLNRLGHWPSAMPLSLDHSVLGLSEADLLGARDAGENERRERVRQLGIVQIDGDEFDASRDGYAAIVDHVNATLRDELLRTGKAAALLTPMPPRSSRDGSRGSGGPGKAVRPTRLSKEQTAAIGLVGETVAYAWLSRRYPNECSPGSWKSAYCETIGEPPGDDTLGYDFEIALKTRTVYFEVKATGGTDASFELSEREVGVARDCVRSSRYQYRVLFITDAMDADRRSLFVIPNPMDPRNAPFFRFPGSGLTCTFKLDA